MSDEKCNSCGGRGDEVCSCAYDDDLDSSSCTECGGTGFVPCKMCGGKGYEDTDKTVTKGYMILSGDPEAFSRMITYMFGSGGNGTY